MLESEFYQRHVRKYLKKQGYEVYRIETGDTAQSIPDVYAVKKGECFWIEMKSIKRECKKVVSPKWQPGQLAFGKKCNKNGIKWALYIMVGSRFMWTMEPKEKYDISELNEVIK